MADETVPDLALTGALFDVPYPLMRRVVAERTISPGKLGILRHLAEHGRMTASNGPHNKRLLLISLGIILAANRLVRRLAHRITLTALLPVEPP